MCARILMKRKVGYMSEELLNKIIDEAKNYHLDSIGLHLFGEPLMHPDIVGFISRIKQDFKATPLLLSTNGFFLNSAISAGIIKSGLDIIRFSVDGDNKKTYEKVRIGSDYDKVVQNINGFLKIRDELGANSPHIQMQILNMADTGSDIAEFTKRWRPFLREYDKILIQPFMTFAGRISDRTPFKTATLKDRIKRSFPCLRLWKNLVVYWDGRVSACCYDVDGELLIGDINSETIFEIWNGKKLQELRAVHLEGRKPVFALCRSCLRQKTD